MRWPMPTGGKHRVSNDGIEINTMNKNLGHLSAMFRAVIKRLKLRLDDLFGGLRQEGGKDGNRPPFPIEFIRNVILAPGNLDKLNQDARDIVYVIMETGARPSEMRQPDHGSRSCSTPNSTHPRRSEDRDDDTPAD